MILIGCGPNEVTVPVMSIVHKELDIGGSFKYKNTFVDSYILIDLFFQNNFLSFTGGQRLLN